jgi:hypothetical protein
MRTRASTADTPLGLHVPVYRKTPPLRAQVNLDHTSGDYRRLPVYEDRRLPARYLSHCFRLSAGYFACRRTL